MQQIGFLIAKLTVRSTCFGHHYTHHQEHKSYTDGCCLWYLALWFTGRWSGVELRVMCPVRRMLQHPANRTHNPQLHTRPTTCKPKRQVPQAATICITLVLLMMGIMVPETCWANSKFCNKETNLLHLVGLLISTYERRCTVKLTSSLLHLLNSYALCMLYF